MKIAGVSHAFPSRVVSNDDILQLLKERSQQGFQGDLDRALQSVNLYLRHVGARQRRWLADGEQGFSCTQRAVEGALSKAGLSRDDIDLVIHASIDRRMLEPATSFFLAKALGLHRAQCFDVTEACSSWTRATQVAQAYLDAGLCRNVLIVTAEYVLHGDAEFSRNFELGSTEELEWAFSSYTIGEGSTATILQASPDQHWGYQNVTLSDMADLCHVALFQDEPQMMQMGDLQMSPRGRYRFVSYGREIQEKALPLMTRMMREAAVPPDKVDLFIPHTQNVSWWRALQQKLELDSPIPYFFLFPEYGNLINNSFPAALSIASEEGRLKAGHQVSLFMTAAGMSFTLVNFVF